MLVETHMHGCILSMAFLHSMCFQSLVFTPSLQENKICETVRICVNYLGMFSFSFALSLVSLRSSVICSVRFHLMFCIISHHLWLVSSFKPQISCQYSPDCNVWFIVLSSNAFGIVISAWPVLFFVFWLLSDLYLYFLNPLSTTSVWTIDLWLSDPAIVLLLHWTAFWLTDLCFFDYDLSLDYPSLSPVRPAYDRLLLFLYYKLDYHWKPCSLEPELFLVWLSL